MEQVMYVVIGILALFAVISIVGILIEPLLRDKEQTVV